MSYASPAIPLPRFANVLFATDFSLCSQAAVPCACALVKSFGGTLHVVHVFASEEHVETVSGIADTRDHDAIARRALADLIDAPPINELRHFASTHRGPVPAVISRIVGERCIDLVVLGTHGRHGLKYFMLGSTAEQIVRHVPCPVLTVGPSAKHAAGAAFARILLATDFSPLSMKALAYAEAVACAHKSTLILFHGIIGELTETEEESLAYLETATADATEQLYRMMPQELPSSCEALIRNGSPTEISPAEMIVQTAIERRVDLIVMGTPRYARAAEAPPRSTVHTVLCDAPCPVMTVSNGS